jgi:hypothetical protein
MFALSLQLGTLRNRWNTHSETPISWATYPSRVEGNRSLVEIDRRYRRGMQLDLIDWRTLVDCAQSSSEYRRFTQFRLLPVFVSAFEIRVGDDNDPYLNFYLGNLPYELCGAGNYKLTGKTLADKVRECSAAALRVSADDPEAKSWSLYPARNLSAMLAFEHVLGEKSLNAALRPHWDALWSVAQLPIWTGTEASCGRHASLDR